MRNNVVRFGCLTAIFLVITLVTSCKQSNKDDGKETILKGKTTILVDETFLPLIEDQVTIFQSEYKAEITLQGKSENELIQAFLKDTSRIAVLSRMLTPNEKKYFDQLKIKPKVTPIGKDAIALISNKGNNDTLIALEDVVSFMRGKEVKGLKGLVFDNPNSSTVRYMNELAGLTSLSAKNVYSFKTNEEVVKFIAENEGMVGFVGLNYLYQPSAAVADNLQNINVLNVKAKGANQYFAPSQNNLAEGTYPLARDLYIINCQGYSGLGMGFASFVAGDIGQRIILKSGLLPIRTPGRKVNFITNKKKENENE
jgi:phosphate transport system substrate-binding protein